MYSLGVKLPTKGRFLCGFLMPWPSYSRDNETRSYLGIFLLGPITMELCKGQMNVALELVSPHRERT